MDDPLICSASSIRNVADEVEARVCRTRLDAPGYCLIDLGDADSHMQRRAMFELRDALSQRRQERTGQELVFVVAVRFDQQVTTKFHLDTGPQENFLMLGYEPSAVSAELAVADYSRCAFDLGLTPTEFLERHNPMFRSGESKLEPYITRLTGFRHDHASILLVNNSTAPFDPARPAWQGLLHAAVIPRPDESQRRIINSTMLAPAGPGIVEVADLDDFRTTSLVRRRGYDKTHLSDDE